MEHNNIKIGSLISVNYTIGSTTIHTISIVEKIDNDCLFCSHSICSLNGGDYTPTKDVYEDYEGELFGDGVKLIDSDEFDVVFDTNIIPKEQLKNVE